MRKQTEKYLCSLTKKTTIFLCLPTLKQKQIKNKNKNLTVLLTFFFNSVKKKKKSHSFWYFYQHSSQYFSKMLLIFSVQLVTFFITAEASLASIKSVGNPMLSDKIGYHQLQTATFSSCFVVAGFLRKFFESIKFSFGYTQAVGKEFYLTCQNPFPVCTVFETPSEQGRTQVW